MSTTPFPSLDSDLAVWQERHKVLLRDQKYPWRLTRRIVGQINGIPTSHGVLVSTNGIECYIEQEQGNGKIKLFRGHIAWFIPDDLEDLAELSETRASKSPSPREAKVRKQLEIY
jgi:hypothetical protein